MIDLISEFERACNKPHEGAAFEALSQRDQILIAIWGLEADVNNGGFHQYYSNSSGNEAFFAAHALDIIGARKMAAIVREANKKFGADGPARDRRTREEQLERLTASDEDLVLFQELDDRFCEYPDDISGLLTVYLETTGAGESESR